MSTTDQLPTLCPGDSHMESLIEAAIQGHADTREAMRWLVRQLVPLQARAQVQDVPIGEVGTMPGTSGFTMACFRADEVPVGTKIYTAPQPAQATQADVTDEQIIAIKKATKAADPTQQWGDTLAFARAILALRPVQVPMTMAQVNAVWDGLMPSGCGKSRYDITRLIEAHHHITAKDKKGDARCEAHDTAACWQRQ